MRSRHIGCTIDLDRIRANAEAVKRKTGVRVVGVIKADAYGLGAARVADAIASVVDDFAYFNLTEAREVGRPGLVIGPPEGEPAEYRELRLRPSIASIADARRFAGIPLTVSVDTGMQRFGCEARDVEEVVRICRPEEFHTHAGSNEAVTLFRRLVGHCGKPMMAACTAMLHDPSMWLDGVRPGLALYRGAMRVSTRLHAVRETSGPIGYTGFSAPRVGIVLGGYSNRVQAAPARVNGRPQRLLEIGMNSSYVTVDPRDRVGDEVVLLGGDLTEAEVAGALGVREHEVLCRYGSMGVRHYASVSTPVIAE
ncbi:MAG: alanine racemase [Planctomycetes bacterium]|nr:alanine racemase [Planctomycetota bacterium]